MAADGGGDAPPVAERLFDPIEGRLFDFYQAVWLLSAVARESGAAPVGVGEGGAPSREAVRFASTLRLTFPTSDVASIVRAAGGQALMTVNFMGLGGAMGPMPAPFCEHVLRRALGGDTATRDFLDIFNHRLVSLMVRMRRRHRIALGVAGPLDDDASRYLFALVGMGMPSLRGQLGVAPSQGGPRPGAREQQPVVQDRTLLYYAGLFARDVRSLAGLTAMLRVHFGVPVGGAPLVGGFYPIEPTHRTEIGPSGRNRRLGGDAVLGARYWDPAACVDLRVGPLGVEDFLRFLPATGDVPAGDRLAPFLTLARHYAGEAVDVRIRLLLEPEVARRAAARWAWGRRARVVGAAVVEGKVQTLRERPRLGYTAWVGRAFQGREVVLQSKVLAGAGEGM